MSPSRALQQVREDGPDRADDAVDVRREQAVERLGVALPQVAADVHACVRDQDVDAAVGFDRPVDQPRDVLGSGDVRDHTGAAGAERGRGLVDALARARGDHHGRTARQQLLSHRAADPAARTGDDRDLAVQTLRHRSSPRVRARPAGSARPAAHRSDPPLPPPAR